MVAPGAAHGVTIVEDDATLSGSFRGNSLVSKMVMEHCSENQVSLAIDTILYHL